MRKHVSKSLLPTRYLDLAASLDGKVLCFFSLCADWSGVIEVDVTRCLRVLKTAENNFEQT